MDTAGLDGGGGGRRGLVQALDPRGRITAAAAFAVVVVALHDLTALAAAVGLGLVAVVAARLPPAATLKRIAAMDGFVVAILLMLPFTTPGPPLFTVGPLSASAAGAVMAVTIALKANAVMLGLLGLVGSMEAVTLGHALYRLRVPESLVHLLLFTVRYVEVIGHEHARLRTAMRARAFRPGNDRHTYRSVGYVVGMLLVRSLERSERILEAMKCRGFQGRFHLLDEHRFRAGDAVFAGLAAAALLGLAALEAGGVRGLHV